jgi:cytochrome c553
MKSTYLLLTMILCCILSPRALIAAEAENGEALFKARCNNCHQYPELNMLKLDQWRRLLDTKQKLMEKAGMQPLTPEEFKNLLEYISKYAKQ